MSDKIDINLFGIDDDEFSDGTIEYRGIVVEVKKMLSYAEMKTFVDFVVDKCFDEDSGEYAPENRDFALRFATIEMYTNINVPNNYRDAYNFLYEVDDLLLGIKDIISRTQFTEMMVAIDSKVEYLANYRGEEMTKKMNEVYQSFDMLGSKLAEMLDGINEDDIRDLISALSNIDENQFVDMYMKQIKDKQEES